DGGIEAHLDVVLPCSLAHVVQHRNHAVVDPQAGQGQFAAARPLLGEGLVGVQALAPERMASPTPAVQAAEVLLPRERLGGREALEGDRAVVAEATPQVKEAASRRLAETAEVRLKARAEIRLVTDAALDGARVKSALAERAAEGLRPGAGIARKADDEL